MVGHEGEADHGLVEATGTLLLDELVQDLGGVEAEVAFPLGAVRVQDQVHLLALPELLGVAGVVVVDRELVFLEVGVELAVHRVDVRNGRHVL